MKIFKKSTETEEKTYEEKKYRALIIALSCAAVIVVIAVIAIVARVSSADGTKASDASAEDVIRVEEKIEAETESESEEKTESALEEETEVRTTLGKIWLSDYDTWSDYIDEADVVEIDGALWVDIDTFKTAMVLKAEAEAETEPETEVETETETSAATSVVSSSDSGSSSSGSSSSSKSSSSKSSSSSSSSGSSSSSSSSSKSSSSSSSKSSSSKSSSSSHTHNWVAQYKTVHHDAVTKTVHYIEPIYETEYHQICNVCGADVTGCQAEHCKAHMLAGEGGGDHSENKLIVTGYNEWDETEVVTAAYDEQVLTGYKCSTCGATKS